MRWKEQGEGGREGRLSEGGLGKERARKGRREGELKRRKGGRETSRKVPQREHWLVYSAQNNAALALETLVLQMKNNEQVYKLSIVMRRNVLLDRWLT